MSEHFSDQDPQARLRAAIAEQAQEQIGWIEAAAQKIGGEDATVEDVFPLPPEVRDDAEEPTWNEEQEAVARHLGETFGYAAETNVSSGTEGGVALLEGGKVWKMWAEAEALKDEVGTKAIVVSGSTHREIGEDEKQFLLDEYERDMQLWDDLSPEEMERELTIYRNELANCTEYNVAEMLAGRLATQRVGLRGVENLHFGYDIREGNPVVYESTGQFMRFGLTETRADVILMSVDRENYTDEDDKPKYRYQPDPMRRMSIVAEMLASNGDTDSPVVFMTSNAYAGSRVVDAIRAGLQNGREFAVAMYGRKTLAEVKHEDILPGARLNQLPGELRVMYENLKQLHAEVTE